MFKAFFPDHIPMRDTHVAESCQNQPTPFAAAHSQRVHSGAKTVLNETKSCIFYGQTLKGSWQCVMSWKGLKNGDSNSLSQDSTDKTGIICFFIYSLLFI